MFKRKITVATIALTPFLTAIPEIAQAESSTSAVEHRVLESRDGRFVFGQINSIRADQFMLDTKNGRLWKVFDDKNADVLVPVSFFCGFNKRGADPYCSDAVEISTVSKE